MTDLLIFVLGLLLGALLVMRGAPEDRKNEHHANHW